MAWMMEHLIETLDALENPNVVLAGDFMLDEYVYGDVERISPEAPVPVLRVTQREYRGGGAGNVAAALSALGATVHCVGVVGADESGRRVRELLEQCGSATKGLLETDARPTTCKSRYVGLAQHKNAQQILRVDCEQTGPMPKALMGRLLRSARAGLRGKATLALQDHNKGLLHDRNTPQMIAEAREAGCAVVVDPAAISDYRRYRGATVLTPNRYEAQRASGVTINGPDDLLEAARRIRKITAAEAVVITLDRDGAFLLEARKRRGSLIPTRPREVADGTGAGDAVMAMLSLAVAGGVDFHRAVELANLSGGLEVERFGVVPVTREEIRAELRHLVGLRRSKVMHRQSLAEELRRQKRSGGRVVFTNGCFDLLHMGHVTYLQQAREQGTCLVVAINSDKSVRRLKGPSRPVIGEQERAEMLAALECVDYVTVFSEDTPMDLLDLLRPDVLVKGGSTDVIVGQEFVEGYGGRVARLEFVQGRSTTDIIQHILETHNES